MFQKIGKSILRDQSYRCRSRFSMTYDSQKAGGVRRIIFFQFTQHFFKAIDRASTTYNSQTTWGPSNTKFYFFPFERVVCCPIQGHPRLSLFSGQIFIMNSFFFFPVAFAVRVGNILAVLCKWKAFFFHFLLVCPLFLRDFCAVQNPAIFALIGPGTKDVNDLVISFLLFRGKDKGIRSRNKPETAGADVSGSRRKTVQFPFDGFPDSLCRIQAQRKSGIVCLGTKLLTIRVPADGARNFLIQHGDFSKIPNVFHFSFFLEIESFIKRGSRSGKSQKSWNIPEQRFLLLMPGRRQEKRHKRRKNAVFGHSAAAFPLIGCGRNKIRCILRMNRSGAVTPPKTSSGPMRLCRDNQGKIRFRCCAADR